MIQGGVRLYHPSTLLIPPPLTAPALPPCRPQVSGDVSGALNRALAVCPGSPEPLQALASLRYEEGRPEEALHLLQQSMSKWFKPRKEQEKQQEKQQQQEQQAQQHEAAVEPVLQKPKVGSCMTFAARCHARMMLLALRMPAAAVAGNAKDKCAGGAVSSADPGMHHCQL